MATQPHDVSNFRVSFPGPFTQHEVVVDGWSVPLIHAQPCGEHDESVMLILDSRLLKNKTATLLNEVVEFLGLPGYPNSVSRPLIHVGRYEGEAPPESEKLLRAFYGWHNQELYQMLNHDFAWL